MCYTFWYDITIPKCSETLDVKKVFDLGFQVYKTSESFARVDAAGADCTDKSRLIQPDLTFTDNW